MQDDYVECPELSGKTIQALRIYKDTGDGTDVQIQLTHYLFPTDKDDHYSRME